MPTTYTNGLKLPDLGSIDWYNSYKNNIDILDPIVGTVNGVATAYAPISHNHSASEITSGTIDIARLPPAALERMHIVADQTARYALTTSTVQEGDTVKQTDTGVMYLVVDSTKLNSADGYTEYSAGTASKAIADEDGTSIKTGYVNVAGNQTVTGDKSFTGSNTFNNILPNTTNTYSLGSSSYQWASVYAQTYYYNGTQWGLDRANAWTDTQSFKDSAYTQGVSVTDRKQDIWKVTDSTDTAFGTWEAIQYTDGKQGFRLCTSNKYKNGTLDPTGNIVPVYFEFLQRPEDGSTILKWSNGFIDNSIYPLVPNTYTFGNAYFQWASVYSQTYYYNGTAWGLDQTNIWTKNNTFKSANTNFGFQSTTAETGSTTASSNWMYWLDKNGYQDAYISRDFWNNGGDTLRIVLSGKRDNGAPSTSGTAVECGIRLDIAANGSKSVNPYTNGDTDLGTSAIKFKTLNGINPGALSLPGNSYIDISGDITIRDGSATNSLTAPCDGWIAIGTFASWLQIANDTLIMAVTGAIGADGFSQAFLPVRKGDSLRIMVNQTNTQFQSFRLIPCFGNV